MANNTPSISVVVPSHNDERYIAECLDSLLGQTLQPSEIIVCDDASTDRTVSVVREWQRKHPEIRLLLVPHEDHVGIPRNFNFGLLAASGEYVSLLAADDYWKPRKLEMEYRLIVERKVPWAYSKVELRFDGREEKAAYQPFRGTSGDYDGDIFLNIVHRQVSPRCFLIEKKALLEVGLFDESIGMYEDWDLKMRLAKAYPIAQVTEVNVIYRQHGGGEHHAPMYRHMAEVSKVLRKCAALLPDDDDATLRRSILNTSWPEGAMLTDLDRAARETALASVHLPYNPVSIKSDGEGLVFLVSLPRSGSTMLQRVLGGHPDIHTTAEPWIMLSQLYALRHSGVVADYDAGVGRQALQEFLDELPGGEENYYDAVRQLGKTLYSRAVRASGKSRFLDKTPRYFYVLPELIRAFPKARFILLLRNPLAILASVLATWFQNDVKAFESSSHYKDMREGPRLLVQAMDAARDNFIITRYEDIIADSEAEINRLCEFLQVPFFKPMLTYGDRPAPPGTLGDPEKVNEQSAPVAWFVDTWKQAFDTPDLRAHALSYVEQIGDEVLSKMGYPAAEMREGLFSQGMSQAEPSRLNSEGETAFNMGDFQVAETSFLAAYAVDRSNIEVCNNLVVLNWQKGNIQQALHYLEQALQLDGKNRNVVINGGQILAAYGCVDEAAGLFGAYLEDNPQDDEIRALLTRIMSESRGAEHTHALRPVSSPDIDTSRAVQGTDYTVPGLAASALRISVVIPSFNQGRFLETTIRSVLDQNYPNLELIVIDGGSTDNSVDVIKKYQHRISYWQSQSDDGQYWAVNEGLRRSSGELMTWINSDDKLHPNSLNAMASIFDQRPDVEWVTGIPNVMNEQGFMTWICEPVPVFSQKNYLQKKYDVPSFIQQEGTFWRRSLWDKAGATLQTDLQMAGDLELWARFFRSAPLYTTTACTGCFRQQKDQKTANAMSLYREEAEKILDREIALATASGLVPLAPVEPLPVQWGSPPEQFAPKLAAALEAVLPVAAARMQTHSAVPGMRQSTKAVRAMHRACEEPLVTAIVSTYNSEKYIRGCLDDLEAQTIAARLEIIVVDSGSAENEAAIVKEYQRRYPNIRYIRTESRETIYSAWNRAIKIARGKYLTNANTDDRHRDDALEHMAITLESDAGVVLVYADTAVTREENADFENASLTGWFRWPDFDARHLFSVCYVGPQPMWRRALHDEYGYFDPRMRVAGDYEFWLRIAPYEQFRHIPEVLGLYLDSKASVEHAFAHAGAQESERAREQNWPETWGQRPPLGAGYFVASGDESGPDADEEKYRQGKELAHLSEPVVSVITATKNRREMLQCALRSVIRQTYQNWEIVLVNDGGDDVADIIARLGLVERVRYLENARSTGQAKARNKALQVASGKIVTFLDDDDLYLPDHLKTVVEAFTDESCVFVYTDADLVQEIVRNGWRREISRSAPYRRGPYSRRQLHIDNYIPINTWAVRKPCLDTVGGFDETLTCCEDWELLLRIAQQHEFTHIERTTVEVRHRADVTDNVTRQRLGETEAVYKAIYSRYDTYCDQDVKDGRRLAIERLRKKLTNLHEDADRVSQGAIEGRPSQEGNNGAERERARAQQRFIERSSAPGYHCPSIHLFVVVDKGGMCQLGDTIEALGQQFYPGWGMTVLSILDSPGGAFDELPMLEWQQVADPLSELRQAMNTSVGEWVGVLNPGDRLVVNALSTVVDYVNQNPSWQFIYADESVSAIGDVSHKTRFKPDFNLDYLLSSPYLGNFCLTRKKAQREKLNGPRHIQSINLELCLDVVAHHGEASVGHIPEILSQRRLAPADEAVSRSLHCEYEKAISTFLRETQMQAELVDGLLPDTFMVDYHLSGRPGVCIAIYAVTAAEKAAQTVASILNKTRYSDYSIRVAIEDGASSVFGTSVDPRVQIDCVDRRQTRTEYLNSVAAEQGAEYLLFLEPGTLAIQEVWLERVLKHGSQKEVGAIGVRLVSPEQRLIHGGIITGAGLFSAGSIAFAGARMDDPGYMNRAQVPQAVSAVSSSCMLISTETFLQAGGFDRGMDVTLFQDIDLCQKLTARKKKVVWTPYVTMLYAGADLAAYRGEQGLAKVQRDADTLVSRWLCNLANDPSYNRNLALKETDFAVDRRFPPAWNPDIHDLPRIVGFGTGSYGSWQYRTVQPMKALQDQGLAYCVQTPFIQKNMILLPTPAEIERIRPDTLLMHNTLHDDCIAALEKYKKLNNAFVVFGQDDLMFALPPKNPFSKTVYKDIKKRIRRCLALADRLVVTTEALAAGLRSMSDDIQVVPNYLDDSIWQDLRSTRNVSRKPRVGWAGAQQHLGDLEMIEEVVKCTAEEVDWVFFGMCPDCLRPFAKEVHDAVRFEEYPEKLARLNLDLAVAPLERNRFNEAKSNLRILEYGVLGWPVVASDIEPFKDAPVCLVRNQPRAWINAIRERAHDVESAWREGDRLRAWVHENWMLSQHLAEWEHVIDKHTNAGNTSVRGGRATA